VRRSHAQRSTDPNAPSHQHERLIEVEPSSLEPIRAMYGEYLFTLESILYRKIARLTRLSDKLKELSIRSSPKTAICAP
jgi:hypothetical protein